MVDITEISAVVAAAGVLVGVVYYVLEMRQQTIIRKTSLMITMYQWIQSREYQEAVRELWNSPFNNYEDYVKRYGTWTSEATIHRAIMTACSPVDMVGTILFRKQIDIFFVYDIWGSGSIKMLYEKVKPIIKGLRREFNEPSLFIGLEYLHDELMKKEPQLRKTWGKYMS